MNKWMLSKCWPCVLVLSGSIINYPRIQWLNPKNIYHLTLSVCQKSGLGLLGPQTAIKGWPGLWSYLKSQLGKELLPAHSSGWYPCGLFNWVPEFLMDCGLEMSLRSWQDGPLHQTVTTWKLASIRVSQGERKKGQASWTPKSCCNLILEATVCHFCCILFVKQTTKSSPQFGAGVDYTKLWIPGQGSWDHQGAS